MRNKFGSWTGESHSVIDEQSQPRTVCPLQDHIISLTDKQNEDMFNGWIK